MSVTLASRWTAIGQVADVDSGPAFQSRNFGGPGEGIRLLRGDNIEPGRLRWDRTRTWPEALLPGYEHLLLDSGDIILAMDRPIVSAGLKLARVLPRDTPALLVQRVARIRPRGVDPDFLYYVLQSPAFADQLRERVVGTQIPHITLASIRGFRFSLPNMDEQRRIVDLLDDHLSRLSAGEQYGNAALTRLDKMRGGVLDAACAGTLAKAPGQPVSRHEVLDLRATRYPAGTKRGRPEPAAAALTTGPAWPEHWARLSLEEVTDPVRTISYGILKPGLDTADGIPYVRVINMRGDVLDVDGLHRTTPAIAAQYARSTLAAGDVLISIRGTYGRVVEVPDSLAGANITQDTARLSFLDPVLPAFAAAYLRTPSAQQFLKAVARGVAVKGVNITDLRTMPFPVPPISEQAEIVRWVDEQMTAMDDVIRSTRSTITRGRVLRRSLLSAALSGALTCVPPPSLDEEPSGD